MVQVTIHKAKTHLSKLIQQALEGEEIIIAKGKRPMVKLVVVPDWQVDANAGLEHRLDTEIASHGIRWLPIERQHCQQLIALPTLHRDPFDRLLIVQAQSNAMALLTADANIQPYAVSTTW